MQSLVGTRFPGGIFTVDPLEHRLFCDSTLSPEPSVGRAHPIYVYHATRAGMGLDIDEFLALCGSSAADGPMFAFHESRITGPLYVGRSYLVDGEITEVTRKEGRKTGVFDIVRFELRLRPETGGEPIATSVNGFILPRRG